MLNRTPPKLETILSAVPQIVDNLKKLAEYNTRVVDSIDTKVEAMIVRRNDLCAETTKGQERRGISCYIETVSKKLKIGVDKGGDIVLLPFSFIGF